jgi:hypothetical protein
LQNLRKASYEKPREKLEERSASRKKTNQTAAALTTLKYILKTNPLKAESVSRQDVDIISTNQVPFIFVNSSCGLVASPPLYAVVATLSVGLTQHIGGCSKAGTSCPKTVQIEKKSLCFILDNP